MSKMPRITAKSLSLAILQSLPNLLLYGICFGYFLVNTTTLVKHFLQYDTSVLVRYESQEQVWFPSFTLCGCSLGSVLCNRSIETVRREELKRHYSTPIESLLDNSSSITFAESQLVWSCDYVLDSKQTEQLRKPCTSMARVVVSVQQGRQCFTYLSALHDGQKLTTAQVQTNVTNNYGNRSHIQLHVNFPGAAQMTAAQLVNSVHEANVVMAIHAAQMLPTFMDLNYVRLEPNFKYKLRFGQKQTLLKEAPYRTDCREYHWKDKPRSQNECVHLCMIEQSFRRTGGRCINYYNLVTRTWLQHLATATGLFEADEVRYCESRDPRNYTAYVATRRDCLARCAQRDCKVEYYQHVVETSQLVSQTIWSSANVTAHPWNNRSVVEIWPDRKLYEVVQHYPELNIFELIGCLGGHAHIFLGLSAIQIYDVVISAIGRVRQFYQKLL